MVFSFPSAQSSNSGNMVDWKSGMAKVPSGFGVVGKV
jgi:hypothetical protein